jgi:hypothetical protein
MKGPIGLLNIVVSSHSSGMDNFLWLADHIGNKMVYAALKKDHMDLFDLSCETKWLIVVHFFQKEAFQEAFLTFY